MCNLNEMMTISCIAECLHEGDIDKRDSLLEETSKKKGHRESDRVSCFVQIGPLDKWPRFLGSGIFYVDKRAKS